MKKIFSLILVFTVLFGINLSFAYAADCEPTFSGIYTVEADCTWPSGGYKVYGDIVVADKTITVTGSNILGVDLSTNKVTFTSGKILFNDSSRMDNSVSNRYYISVSYTSNSGETNCPAGYDVLDLSPSAFIPYSSLTPSPNAIAMGLTGTFYCGKQG